MRIAVAAGLVALVAGALTGCSASTSGTASPDNPARSAASTPASTPAHSVPAHSVAPSTVVPSAGVPTVPTSAASAAAGPPPGPWTKPEFAAAKRIRGLIYHREPAHNHVLGTVHYDTTPPTGGNHSAYWADCSGTVYPHPIANENAVHMLEHGAVWITYRPGLAAAQVKLLRGLVKGQNYTALSPYPRLKSAVSLQAWGYQLFVPRASDPRVAEFIATLRDNPAVAPEYPGICSQPTFVAHPSTFGHPLEGP